MRRAATVPCRACSAELAEGARKCDRCGVLQRDDVRCPHCGAVADAAPHPELIFACEACGGPRVPQDDAILRSKGGETAALRRAEAARSSRARWTAVGLGASALLAMTLGTLGIAGLLFGAGVKLAVAATLLATPLVLLLATAVGRVRARTHDLRPSLDAAWQAAAADLARGAASSFGAADLARALRVDEARAEELLALLDATDIVRGDVSADGELTFRPTVAPRVRVDVPVEPSGDAAAELDAQREAEAHAEARADGRPETRAGKAEG